MGLWQQLQEGCSTQGWCRGNQSVANTGSCGMVGETERNRSWSGRDFSSGP